MKAFVTIRAHGDAPRGSLAIRGASGYLSWRAFAAPWDGARYVAFLERVPPKTFAKIDVIDIDGALVVRRSRIAKILAPFVAAGSVVLRPVVVSSRKISPRPRFEAALVDEDFCVVDPTIEVAPDRRALGESAFEPKGVHPERAIVTYLDTYPFTRERSPDAEIFRLHDLPSDIWVKAALLEKLTTALHGQIALGRTRPSPSFVSIAKPPPLPLGDDAAKRAAKAYFDARRRAPTKAERTKILASARYAHLLARREGARDDTRAAACTHPFYGLVYARDVDRTGRNDTRKSAAKEVETAIRYALEVDRAAHETTRGALRDSYRLGEYDEWLAALAPARTTDAAPALHVVALKGHGNAHVNVLSSPQKDTAWGIAFGDGDVTVDVIASSLRASAYSDSFSGPWVLERAIAEKMFEGVSSVALRKTKVRHKGKAVRADLVFVDVLVDLPLDRDAAGATYADPKRPWSSIARAVTDVRVLAPAGSDLVMARVTEFPGLFVVSAALAERWKKVRAPVRLVPPPHAHLSNLPVFPLWNEPSGYPNRAAPDAMRAVLGGDLARRTEAIAHPGFAYAIARLVDRKATNETRASAVRHPHFAALYARFVDQKPRDDTRAAAARCGPTAVFYARYVDRGVRGPIKLAFAKDGLEI